MTLQDISLELKSYLKKKDTYLFRKLLVLLLKVVGQILHHMELGLLLESALLGGLAVLEESKGKKWL